MQSHNRNALFYAVVIPLIVILLVFVPIWAVCTGPNSSSAKTSDAEYQRGYDAGYDDGYERGSSDGFLEGYETGYKDALVDYHQNNFVNEWEDWLKQSYGITEQQLCALLGFATNTPTPTPKSTATPSPSPSPTPSPSPSPSPTPTPKPTARPASSFNPLVRGSTGSEVVALQQRLNELGYDVGAADGIYGDKTYAGVCTFQIIAKLSATGSADRNTQAKLFADTAPRLPAGETLRSPRPTSTPKPTATPRPTATPKATATPKPKASYIGNRNTGKFHYSWCSSVDQMKESNKVAIYSRSSAINSGYVPCKRCEP